MSQKEIQKEISQIQWFHSIDLGNGMTTPGRDNSSEKLKTLGFPAKLDGWSVLDIGALDGFFSFEAEKRGANPILSLDSVCWEGNGKAGFELARKILKSKVGNIHMEVLDISPEKIGQFDLVLFLGVLYHMRHPLLALEKVASVTRKQLILETHVDLLGIKRPAMAFYPDAELNNDISNWVGPNPTAVEGMLKTVGFKKIEFISSSAAVSRHGLTQKNSIFTRTARAFYHKIKQSTPFFESFHQGRMVFHAWK